MSIEGKIKELRKILPDDVALVAVSKTYPSEDIRKAYDAGQRVFGESRPQEMKAKYEALPKDIRWHMIGHLQTNKVKYIAPFVELIHSVDSGRLLETVSKEAVRNGRTIDVLLEVLIAAEETKHGWTPLQLREYLASGEYRQYTGVHIRGLMGIASLTDDMVRVKEEFTALHSLFRELGDEYFGGAQTGLAASEAIVEVSESAAGQAVVVVGDNCRFDILSMGMTSDWETAVECGSNMVRIGSYIFGARDYGQPAQGEQ